MWTPDADKNPLMYFPCPGNDETAIEPGMFGIKDAASGREELWFRPPRVTQGDAEPDPVLAANAGDIAVLEVRVTDNESDISALQGLTHADLPGDNNSDATEQHYDSVPVVGTNAIDVTNPNDATDNFLVATRDLTLIKSGESITDKSVGGAFASVGRDRFFVVFGDDDMYAFDTRTGKKVDENLTDFNNRALLCKDDKLLLFGSYSGNMVVEIDQNDLSEFTNIAVTGLPGVVFDSALKTSNGSMYVLDSDGYISVMSSAYIITATFSVESAGRAQSLCFSKDENSIFVFSAITGGDAHVKEFDTSGTLLNTSAAISGLEKPGSRIRPVGDQLCVYSAGKILYFDPDNIDGAPPSFMSSAALPGVSCVAIAENVLYRVAENGSDVDMAKYQLPALTTVTPKYIDSRGGGGVKSADGVFESDGVTRAEVSKQDEIRACLAHINNSSRRPPFRLIPLGDGLSNEYTVGLSDEGYILKPEGVCASGGGRLRITAELLAIQGFRFYVQLDPGFESVYVEYYDSPGSGYELVDDTLNTEDTIQEVILSDGKITVLGLTTSI